MNIVMTKEALISHLTHRLKLARAEDDRLLKEHQKAEQRALVEYKDKIRKALKWTYAEAKQFHRTRDISFESPSCPRPQSTLIDRELRCVKIDTRKRGEFTIVPKTDLYDAVQWLPEAERPKASLCD